MKNPVSSLKLDDFIYIRDKEQGFIPVVLRDVFEDQVLVESPKDNYLLLAHRNQVKRMSPPKYLN